MPQSEDLTWPEAYATLLPSICEQWGVEGEIHFRQQLGGGKSGALVYIADITCSDFSGLAILKLDQQPDPEWQEKAEPARHRDALEAAPGYGARHLPRIVHTLESDGGIAILSTVVGQGLEYSMPWADCGYRNGLDVIQRLSRSLLEDWNEDYRLAAGLHMPGELLETWLGYRLDPKSGGRIHEFLAETCGIKPDEPSVSFEGVWYPNPLAFALGAVDLPSRLHLRPVTGRMHGDLHGFNVLVRSHGEAHPDYFLIDLALYEDGQLLFYDHAYFEMAYLLARREFAGSRQWDAMLDDLSLFHHMSHPVGLWQDDLGMMEMVRVLRREAMDWVERHESHRLSFLESQYLLARVACGLNFVHKNLSEGSRRKAFIYAASNLKDYLKLNNVDWPKHGPAFGLESSAKSKPADEDEAAVIVAPTEPPAEKDRLLDRMVAQLPQPQKPVIAVMPFQNLTGDPEDESFADGFTHEIIAQLSQVDWLAVISPGSTFSFKGKQVNADEIAQKLGAHYMVEGNVRKGGDNVRVIVHLVDTSSGHDLWSNRFARKLDDVFELQEDIAEAVVDNIDWEVKFDVRERARLKRGEVSVWDRVQKAMWHMLKFTDDDDASAGDILSKTIDLTPDYAFAHAGMALVELRKVAFAQSDDPAGARERALRHAERAIALDERNSFARAMYARACSSLGLHDRAITEAETAIGLNPSSANSYLILAIALAASGRVREALPHIDTSIKRGATGPYAKIKIAAKSFCLYLLDEQEAAEDCVRPVIESRAVGPFGKLILAAVLVRQNRLDEANRFMQECQKIRPDLTTAKIGEAMGHIHGEYLNRFIEDLTRAGLPE